MKLPEIDIAIDADGWPDEDWLRALGERAITAAATTADLNWSDGAQLSLLFTDDARMTEINGEWRGQKKPTNVLSFPGDERNPGDMAHAVIGDLVFARQTLEREAKAEGKTVEAHLTHLFVHGFLHLFGYDHIEADDAEIMEAIEVKALAALGIANPYD